VVAYINRKPEFYPDAREVDKVVEVALEEILNPDIIGRKVINVRGVEVDAPFYNIQDHIVWGATAMMIAELVEILNSIK
jgi:hypothetical protein